MAKFNKNDDSLVVIIGSGAGGGTLGYELAKKGVKSVINHLTVAKPPTLKQIGKDNAAVGLFRTKIGLDQDISSLNFSIDVVDGIAYLSGIAKDEIEMNKVIYHAENTRFISDVMNYITLSIDQRD